MLVYSYKDDMNLPTHLFQHKGDTPLHTAVRGRNLSMVKMLLERRDIEPNKVNEVYHPCYISTFNHFAFNTHTLN